MGSHRWLQVAGEPSQAPPLLRIRQRAYLLYAQGHPHLARVEFMETELNGLKKALKNVTCCSAKYHTTTSHGIDPQRPTGQVGKVNLRGKKVGAMPRSMRSRTGT